MDNDDDYSPSKRFNFSELMHRLAFSCVLLNIILSPWCFGSWEMWWFWPMATLIFSSCFFSGVGTLLPVIMRDDEIASPLNGHFKMNGSVLAIFITALSFFIYAVIRAEFPSAPGLPLVAMETERSLLLFFTPAAIATVMFLSFTRRRVKILAIAFLVNALIIAIYALVLKLINKENYVLWVLSPWDYKARAKGPFFCPNHLSAYLNLGICLCLAVVFSPKIKIRLKTAAATAFILIASANFLTLSRGGISSLLIGLFIALPFVAMRGHRLIFRLLAPIIIIGCIATTVLAIRYTSNPLMERINRHNLYKTVVKSWGTDEWGSKVHDAFWYGFDRGTYIQSALRAWKSNPVWGIGPGQHSNRWAEFNPTDDAVKPINGDISTMKRPRYVNNSQHLYEVHSDWTQLLEEYGVVGLILFLIPMCVLLVITYSSQSTMNHYALKKTPPKEAESDDNSVALETKRRRSGHHRDLTDSMGGENISQIERALPLASLMACIIMIIHSFGDFSFQMPSITWAFAILITGGVLASARTGDES